MSSHIDIPYRDEDYDITPCVFDFISMIEIEILYIFVTICIICLTICVMYKEDDVPKRIQHFLTMVAGIIIIQLLFATFCVCLPIMVDMKDTIRTHPCYDDDIRYAIIMLTNPLFQCVLLISYIMYYVIAIRE